MLVRQASYYLELTKPKVCLLLVFTAGTGMMMNPATVPWSVIVLALAGIWLAAAAAASVNHLIERNLDKGMQRTAERPLARGRLSVGSVIAFSAALSLLAMWLLFYYVNHLTAWLTLASLLGYAFVYTVWLKRATSQNIVIGGVFGATPPLLGYTAISGTPDPIAWQMFLIIFLWTPAHFWSLAIARKKDYQSVGLPMLPITHGDRHTALNIFLYTVLLLISAALPWLTLHSGLIYLIASSCLGVGYLYYAILVQTERREDDSMAAFYYSVHYLIWLFAFLVVDHYFYQK